MGNEEERKPNNFHMCVNMIGKEMQSILNVLKTCRQIKEKMNWDKAIDKGDERYNMEVHNLLCNNCHSHCAYVLNVVKYKNRSNYNMISIWWMIVTKGKYVSFIGFVKSYIGFFIFLILVILIYKNFY